MELHPVGDAPDLRGACVVLPAVAFFNVGELAVDALVATLRGTLAARLGSSDVLPVVGNDAYDHPGSGGGGVLATALELYAVPGSKLYLLQQRAPAIAGRQAAFAESLADWLAAAGVGQVVVLSGLDAQYRTGSQLEGPQERHLTASGYAAAAAAAAAARGGGPAAGGGAEDARRGVAGLALAEGSGQEGSEEEASLAAAAEAAGARALERDAAAREAELHPLLPPWPLLAALAARGAAGAPGAPGAPAALLLGRFASEGDNVADALALAGAALRLAAGRGLVAAGGAEGASGGGGSGDGPRLVTPGSWSGLYGRPAEEVA